MRKIVTATLIIVPVVVLAGVPFDSTAVHVGADVKDAIPLPEIISSVLGFFAPIAIQFLSNRLSTRTSRFLVALLLAAVTGGAAFIITKPPITDAVDVIIYAFGTSQTAYMMFWRPLWDSRFKLFGLGTIRTLPKKT